jgi:hypothetical protein
MASLDEKAVRDRLREIELDMSDLAEERRRLIEALDLKQLWLYGSRDGGDDPDAPDLSLPMKAIPEAHMGLGGPAPRTRVEAALRVMGLEPDREWTAPDLAVELVRLGWMGTAEGELESLGAQLGRLAKDRRIHRPRRGAYRLTPPDGDA